MKVIVGTDAPIDLGATESTPTIGITDYSRRVTDDFGVTTVVERGFSRRMSVRMALPFDEVDGIQRLLADLRATSALWIADDDIAWLQPTGFYKDFEVDLNVPPLSFCTLTVEGLAETETVADPGGDPAPEGSASTLQMLLPVTVTDAVLASSSVPEDDGTVWGPAITYAVGSRVIRTGSHRVFESLVAGNIGHDPLTSPAQWLDVGPMNRWAMFDEALGTVTSAAGGSIVVAFDGGAVGAVALLDIVGTSVQVEVIATGDVDPTYDRTIAATGGALGFYDLPGIAGTVRVTVSGSGTVSVGTLLIGDMVGLGVTEASPTAGITDYSRKDVDDFGDVTIVERAWAKRMATNALIRTDAVDLVANRIAAVRARPVLWIGDEGLDSLTVYGFFRDFSIEVGETVSKLALSIEGLSKAQALKAPWADDIDQLSQAIDRIASDGFLNAGEKPQASLDWNALTADYNATNDRYVTLGSPADVTPFQSDADSKIDALATYLAGLVPSWTDTTQDTPIDPVVYQQKWVDAYTAMAAFRAAITGRVGDSALTGRLTNADHTVPATNAGVVTSYAGAAGTFDVRYGTNNVTAACTFSVVANPQALTNGASALINAATGVYTITGGLDAGEDSATVTFRATHPTYGPIDAVFSLGKSKAGLDGATPPIVLLSTDFLTFDYNAAGVLQARTITFKAQRNVAATTTTVWTIRNNAGAVLSTGNAATVAATGYFSRVDDDTLTMTHLQFAAFILGQPTRETFTVEAASSGISDKVSVSKLADGANAKHLYLDPTGEVFRYDGTGAIVASQSIKITIRAQNLATTTCVVRAYRLNADETETQLDAGLVVTAGSGASDNTPDANSITQLLTDCTVTGASFSSQVSTGQGIIVEVVADGITTRQLLKKVQDGADGLSAVVQGSVSASGPWHAGLLADDVYMRSSNDSGATYGPAVLIKGETGDTEYDSFVFKISATQPATPTDNTGDPPTGWTDAPTATSGAQIEWWSKARFRAGFGQITSWSTPARVTGQAGEDGISSLDVTTDVGSSVVVNCTPDGTPKAAVPGFTITVKQAGVDVTSLATYGPRTQANMVGLSGGNAVGANVITLTGMSADNGYVDVPISYGSAESSVRVTYKKINDPKPFVNGTDSTISNPAGSTYGEVGRVSLTMGPNGTLKADYDVLLNSTSAAGSTIDSYLEISTDGGVNFSPLTSAGGTATAALPAFDVAEVYNSYSGSGSSNGITSSMSVIVRLMMRRVGTGTSSINSGQLNVSWTG